MFMINLLLTISIFKGMFGFSSRVLEYNNYNIIYVSQSNCDIENDSKDCYRQIHSFNPLSQLQASVSLPVGEIDPASLSLSPDGHRIAFTFAPEGTTNLYVLDMNSLTLTQITHLENAAVSFISWSYNEPLIAFLRATPDNPYPHDLTVVNTATFEQETFPQDQIILHRPGWSPDGTEIVVAASSAAGLEMPDIYRLNLDDQEYVNLTPETAADYAPTWSPQGDRIAFVVRHEERNQIAVMNADGSGYIRLTSDVLPKAGPQWAMGGTHILYIQSGADSSQFVLLNVETRQVQTLLTAEKFAASSVSPDGAQFAYIAIEGQKTALCIYDFLHSDNVCYPQTNPDPNAIPVWRSVFNPS